MKGFVRLLFATLIACLGAAAPASAATLFDGAMSASGDQFRRCHDRPAPGAPGVTTQRVSAATGGFVSARLTGPASSDWDLAVFDAQNGRLVAGSAGPQSTEVAQGFVGPQRELLVQACRLAGDARTVDVKLSAFEMKDAGSGKIQLVRVNIAGAADKDRLQRLGLDLTEHGRENFVEVVLHGTADENKLRAAGFTWSVEIADMVARRIENAQKDAERAARVKRGAVPSGRTTYRRLVDYESDLKKLAGENPGLVKLITLPNKSLEGRQVMGVEITKDVNVDDGKPIFLQLGVHHAREWPSGEHAIEWAFELVNGFKSGDARVTRLLDRTRNIVVPIVNVDGFNLSREALVDTRALNDLHPLGYTATLLADQQISFAYKRRNCRIEDGKTPSEGQCADQENRMLGVDPNRNYGALWGGPGADSTTDSDTYRGAAPFSEPETQNIQRLVSSRQVTTLITNHTFSNLILRPPGVRAQGPPPDETVFKALGAKMASHNGYTNQKGYELYDTTGTTEDWSYAATGGMGYTFEIGPDEFHPPYADTEAQYNGHDGLKGNREAYFEALEGTANPALHSVIEGKAPAGSTIRLRKDFPTATSPVIKDTSADEPQTGPAIQFQDKLSSTMTVPSSGAFTLHANPSTRPQLMANRYFDIAEKPAKTIAAEDAIEPTLPGGGDLDPPHSVEVPFKVGADIPEADRFALRVFLNGENGIPSGGQADDDYDIYLFRVLEGGGRQIMGSSASASATEEIVVEGPPTGEYVLKVVNWLAKDPRFSYKIETYARGKETVRTGSTESWVLSCERGGRVVDEQKVIIGRGQRTDVGAVCGSGSVPTPVGLAADVRGALAAVKSPLRFSVKVKRAKLRTALRRGLSARAACSAPCTVDVALVRGKKNVVARGKVTRAFTGSRAFKLRFNKKAIRSLRRVRATRLTLVATVRDATGVRQVARGRMRLSR